MGNLNYLISIVKDTNNTDIAYNIMRYSSNGVAKETVPANKMRDMAKFEFQNIEIDKRTGAVTGTNGVLNRYPTFKKMKDESLKAVSHQLVVITKLNDGFVLADGKGNLARLNYKEAVSYFRVYGIANGKLVSDDKDKTKQLISSIRGNYPTEDAYVSAKTEPVKGTDKKPETDKYSESFYKVLERVLGRPKTSIIKYIVETKKKVTMHDIEQAMIAFKTKSDFNVGIIFLALDVYLKEAEKDKVLKKLILSFVEPTALETLEKEPKNFDKLWDGMVSLGYMDKRYDEKYEITMKAIKDASNQ